MVKKKLFIFQKVLSIANKAGRGFTLIELLVVIIIMGILAMIALPNFLGYVGRARETEAKKGLSTIGLAQQVYFTEHLTFADSLSRLGGEVTLNTEYYNMEPVPFTLLNNGLTVLSEAHALNAVSNNTRNYALGVYYNNGIYSMVICQSTTPSLTTQAPSTQTGSCTNGDRLD